MSGWLQLESDGGISVDEGAALELGRNAGRFQLARTAPDLLLAIRGTDGERQAPIGRVAFCGDLDGLPFSDVATMLAQGRRSGLLHVIAGAVERVLVFASGELIGASSTQAGERLGEVALRMGLLERADLAGLLSHPSAGRRVGQRLVERGLLDRESLADALRQQITLVFEAILLRPVGTFYFRDHPVPPEKGGTAVGVQALLLDGLRRLDEWAHYRTRIPSQHAQVRPTGHGQAALDAIGGPLLDRLQRGPSSTAELAAALRLPEVEVMRALFHLAEAGAVEVGEDRATRPLAELGADPLPLRELLVSFNRVFAEIFTEVALAGDAGSFFAEAAAALVDDDGDRLFAGLEFAGDGALPIDEILKRLPEVAQQSGKGPRAALLEALQPVLARVLRHADARLDDSRGEDLHARLRLLFGMSEW